MTTCAILKSRGIVHIFGPDAFTFLQGMITNDLNKATTSQAIYTALLTPQGRFLHDFFVIRDKDDGFLIDCALDEIEELTKRFKMFLLRSKVKTADLSAELSVVVAKDPIKNAISFADPRLPDLGYRNLVRTEETKNLKLDADDASYFDQLMTHGIPNGRADMPPEKAIILEYGFIDLNGIDFNKGCYLGQELMARTHHQGAIRKRVFPITITGVPGEEITLNGEKAGKLISTRGQKGLAMLYTDKAIISINSHIPLQADAATIAVAKPAWMKID